MDHIKILSLIAAVACLSACGGGSSSNESSAGTVTTTPIADVVASSGTLQTSAIGSTYAADSVSATAYDALNAARLASGAGAINQSMALDAAAQAHAAYQTALGQMTLTDAQRAALIAADSPHGEVASIRPDLFYSAMPMDRALKAGAITSAGWASEGITGAWRIDASQHLVDDGAACIKSLLGSVYHADAALSPATQVAIAKELDGIGTPGCIVDDVSPDLYGQVAPSGRVVVNPAPDTTVPGVFAISGESPRPARTQITTDNAGTPVLANFRNADYINAAAAGVATPTVTSFTLTNAGVVVPAVILANPSIAAGAAVTLYADSMMFVGSVALIPTQPLPAGVYAVHFAATINAGLVVTKDWTFTAQ